MGRPAYTEEQKKLRITILETYAENRREGRRILREATEAARELMAVGTPAKQEKGRRALLICKAVRKLIKAQTVKEAAERGYTPAKKAKAKAAPVGMVEGALDGLKEPAKPQSATAKAISEALKDAVPAPVQAPVVKPTEPSDAAVEAMLAKAAAQAKAIPAQVQQ